MLDRLLSALISASLSLLLVLLLARALEPVVPGLITFVILLWFLRLLVRRQN